MEGQTDSQVGLQVAESRKFHAYTDDLRSTWFNFRWVVIGQMVENLRWLAYEFELDQSQCKLTQVGGQKKHKLNASRKLVLTCESVWPGL